MRVISAEEIAAVLDSPPRLEALGAAFRMPIDVTQEAAEITLFASVGMAPKGLAAAVPVCESLAGAAS